MRQIWDKTDHTQQFHVSTMEMGCPISSFELTFLWYSHLPHLIFISRFKTVLQLRLFSHIMINSVPGNGSCRTNVFIGNNHLLSLYIKYWTVSLIVGRSPNISGFLFIEMCFTKTGHHVEKPYKMATDRWRWRQASGRLSREYIHMSLPLILTNSTRIEDDNKKLAPTSYFIRNVQKLKNQNCYLILLDNRNFSIPTTFHTK